MILIMISRISIYLRESFNLLGRLFLVSGYVIIIQLYTIEKFDTELFLASFSMFLFSLLYCRICDEIKDEKTDKVFFPKRPLPSGRVYKSDLYALLALSGFAMVFISFYIDQGRTLAFILLADCLLMQFDFFVGKKIEKNKLIAFATHAPYYLFINLYMISLHIESSDQTLLKLENIALLLALTLPRLHWEIIRKTSIREKPGYQSYSTILGYQGAILLSLSFFFPFALALHILVEKVLFTPIIVGVILYCMHLWGLGLRQKEGLMSLKLKSELLFTLVFLVVIYQKYGLVF